MGASSIGDALGRVSKSPQAGLQANQATNEITGFRKFFRVSKSVGKPACRMENTG
jgi:hypothetical protein